MKTQVEMFRAVAAQLFVERMKNIMPHGAPEDERETTERVADRALCQARVFMEVYNTRINDEGDDS